MKQVRRGAPRFPRVVLTGRGLLFSALVCSALRVAVHAGLPDASCKGYVNHTQLVIAAQGSNRWTTGQVTLARLDGSVFVLPSLTITAAGRSRLMYGQLYETVLLSGYAPGADDDAGYADMSSNLWKNSSALLNLMVDRCYIDYAGGDWQFRLGRHRINWGKTLIWNPNDLFNAYSSFDILYPEGPGADALLVRRYMGAVSQVELVVAKTAASFDSTTIAALGQINTHGTDIQLFAGWMQHVLAFGTGFSGQVKSAAVRGEVSFFTDESFGENVQTTGCLSVDYTFPHETWGQFAVLYNSNGRRSPSGGFASLLNSKISARHLSDAQYQCYAQVSYPVTPLWNTSLAAMLNPFDGSAVIMPATSVSLAENLEVTFQAQLQAGAAKSQFGGADQAVYASMQMNY